MMMMMPVTKETKWAQMQKKQAEPVHLYVEVLDEGDHHLRVIYVIRRSERSVEENDTLKKDTVLEL